MTNNNGYSLYHPLVIKAIAEKQAARAANKLMVTSSEYNIYGRRIRPKRGSGTKYRVETMRIIAEAERLGVDYVTWKIENVESKVISIYGRYIHNTNQSFLGGIDEEMFETVWRLVTKWDDARKESDLNALESQTYEG